MTSPHTIAARMQSLVQSFEETADRRAIFLNCYLMMTQNMLAAAEAGAFQDTAWVNRLLHHFADYYFQALDAYNGQHPTTPAVWQLAHTTAAAPDVHVLQHLFLGINAHINYDLVLTLVDLLEPAWATMSADERAQRYADYYYVNVIIRQTVDAVQNEVLASVSPVMRLVDVVFGPLDEWLIAHVITNWRDEVWEKAVAMMNTADEAERQQLHEQLVANAMARAATIHFTA